MSDKTVILIGADEVLRASSAIAAAAHQMQSVASQIEDTMQRRRQWEEEYLQRLEALLRSEEQP